MPTDLVAARDAVYASGSLQPLPRVLTNGLAAVSFFGYLSFISSTSLFFYLSYKFILWRLRGQANQGINQFILLVYNLVIADIQQSLAFLLTSRWLIEDKINVDTSICFAQGWFVSTGDLASSVWIFAIGVHTFLALVKEYRIPSGVFYMLIAALWIFIYLLAIIGIVIHPHGLYVRAGAWCWIDARYAHLRLWLHYFWIFLVMFGTVTIYIYIFIVLRQRVSSSAASTSSSSIHSIRHRQRADPETVSRAARYMVIYPFIYVICTLPLAAGRAAAMAGHTIPYAYYCVAGAAITSNGWLDVILYALTRRVLVFNDSPSAAFANDLNTFGLAFQPGGTSKFWGTTTTVEGGVVRKGRPLSGSSRNNHHTPRQQMHLSLKTSSDHQGQDASRSGSMDDLFGAGNPTPLEVPVGHVMTTRTVQIETSAMPDLDHADHLHQLSSGGAGSTSDDEDIQMEELADARKVGRRR